MTSIFVRRQGCLMVGEKRLYLAQSFTEFMFFFPCLRELSTQLERKYGYSSRQRGWHISKIVANPLCFIVMLWFILCDSPIGPSPTLIGTLFTFGFTPRRQLVFAFQARSKCIELNGLVSFSAPPFPFLPVDYSRGYRAANLTYLGKKSIFLTWWAHNIKYYQ